MLTLAVDYGIAFEQPRWLLLAPVLWLLAVWIGRQSLSGMGTGSRRVALLVRLLVIGLVVAAVARPQWRREGKNVNVAAIIDVSDSVRQPRRAPDGTTVSLTQLAEAWLTEAGQTARPGDTMSRLTAARKSYVQSLSIAPAEKPDLITTGDTDATDLADAVLKALAIPGIDRAGGAAAKRILLISDGNETAGSLRSAAAAARSAGVKIDVRPVRYKYAAEIIVDKIVAPATARKGQNINLRVLLTSLRPATGRLTLLVNGDPVRLGDAGAGGAGTMDMPVSLDAGPNVIPIPMSLPLAGPQRFEAVFTPDNPADDAIAQNNRSLAITFVQSEGRVLVVAPSSEEVAPLVAALNQSKLNAEVVAPAQAPKALVDWGAFDAVVLANTPSNEFTPQQQEDLKSYVQDLGGGLVMVGGPESFGAGGWIGSPVADALPIKLDPPQQRKMPRGALALIMHSCEMPRGNYWGQQVCLAAINNLSRLDLVGLLEYSFGKGDWWVHPLSEVGNRAAVTRAINSLTFGDMKVLDGLLNKAIGSLAAADAGARHIIIISDGDATLGDRSILQRARANRITISTVMVFPHDRTAGSPYWEAMRSIANTTGGRFYPVIDEGEFARLPAIFIKEAQVVKRSLIWEGPGFSPAIANAVSEPMRGLTRESMPQITGYIVAAEREGLSVVTLRGKENDPVLAHWQFGLGKSVAFTSDASVRWAKAWPSWDKYRAFWEQHIRWAMRPGGNADMRVTTEDLGDRTRVRVEALDPRGERLNFVRFAGRVVGPGNATEGVELRQTGPGRYEGVFDSAKSGAYIASLRYSVPAQEDASGVVIPARDGSILAAVSRPYADEFRSLEDNAALLRTIAELTGGRVLPDDPKAAAIFDREGLKMPADLRPIWMLTALLALGVFLLDVAVRRVRIDPALIAAAVRRGLGRGEARSSEQLGSLKEARGRARQSAAAPAAPQPPAQTASTKFEATDAELKAGNANQSIADPARPTVRDPAASKPAEGIDAPPEEGGLSRLKKARERAQEKFEDDDRK